VRFQLKSKLNQKNEKSTANRLFNNRLILIDVVNPLKTKKNII